MAQKSDNTTQVHSNSENTDEQLDAYIKKLKIVVTVLGVLLLGGFGFLIYAIVMKTNPQSNASKTPNIVELTKENIVLQKDGLAPVFLEYIFSKHPQGFPSYEVNYTHNHIFVKVHYTTHHEIMVYDLERFTLIGSIKLSPPTHSSSP